MPSGRDSFRRNRVAPSVQFYFTTSARLWGVCLSIGFRFSVKHLQSLGKIGDWVPRKARRGPLPRFFVSVASKGLSATVSLLFATLAGRFISVADKGLMGRA